MSEEEPDLIRRCAAAGCTSPDSLPRRVIDDRLACPGCAERSKHYLTTLGHRYVRLYTALRPGSPGGEPISGPGFGSRSPVRDAAFNAMDELTRWAIRSEVEVRTALHLTPRHSGNVRPQVALACSITVLTAFWDDALHHDAGLRALNGVDYWRRRTDLILGWDRLVHRLPAPCPYCDTITLVREDGDDQVRCRTCHRAWAEAEYRHFVRMLVEEVT